MSGSDCAQWRSACGEKIKSDCLNSPAEILRGDTQMMCYQVQIALHRGWAQSRLRNEVKKWDVCEYLFRLVWHQTGLARIQTGAPQLRHAVHAGVLFIQMAPKGRARGRRSLWEDSHRTLTHCQSPVIKTSKPADSRSASKRYKWSAQVFVARAARKTGSHINFSA